MGFEITQRNKHDPLINKELVLSVLHGDGNEPNPEYAYELVLLRQKFPTRRHFYHHIHSEFDAPCDQICEPAKKRYSGGNLIQRIKAAYRVEDVAQRVTELYGFGNTLTGKCPLHQEVKGRAFTVWVDEQRWRCFGRCGIGGDVINFVEELDSRGIEWRERSNQRDGRRGGNTVQRGH